MSMNLLAMKPDIQSQNGVSTMDCISNDSNKTTLIINYLPSLMTEEEIHSLFSRVGEVESVKLVRDWNNLVPDPFKPGLMIGQSLAYGFVSYYKAEHAEQAVNILNGLLIQNKTIRVSYARPSSDAIKGANIYIAGLPQTMTHQELDTIFQPYGTIISSRVLHNQGIYPQSKGVGFIRFNTREQANQAIESTNGTIPNGCFEPISVKFSNAPGNKAIPDNSTLQTDFSINQCNLYISGLPRTLTLKDLVEIFRPFGTIISSHIIPNPSSNPQMKNVGFIRYGTKEEALGAIQSVNNSIPNGCDEPISVKFSNVAGSTAKFSSANSMEPLVDEHNLYISGLPNTMSQNELESLFLPFGKIITSRIVHNTNELDKSIGFIRYEKRSDANNAILAMNGKTPPNCRLPIVVKFSNIPGSKKQLEVMSTARILPNVPRSIGAIHNPVNKGLSRFSPMAGDLLMSQNVGDGTGTWNIFVYNLRPETEDSELWQLFGPFGAVKTVKIVRDAESKQCKGYGFVNMSNYEEAMMAIRELNGSTLGGRVLQVSFKSKKQFK